MLALGLGGCSLELRVIRFLVDAKAGPGSEVPLCKWGYQEGTQGVTDNLPGFPEGDLEL